MSRYSKSVVSGGVFHPPKVKYSKETCDLLNILMEESKISMLTRKKLNYHLRQGEPLPIQKANLIPKIITSNIDNRINLNKLPRRKPFETIKKSGAYDIPKFRSMPNLKESRDEAKQRLQSEMSGIKISENLPEKPKPKIEIKLNIPDQIDKLVQEIKERTEWLNDMEALGEGKKFRDMITLQVAERLNEIKLLEKQENIEI